MEGGAPPLNGGSFANKTWSPWRRSDRGHRLGVGQGDLWGGRGLAWASQMALVIKNLPANAGDARDMSQSLGWEDPLEKGMTVHSRILA